MIIELCVMLTFCIPGMGILHACGVRGGWLAALGFIAGIALYVTFALGQAVLGLSTHPGWTIALTWLSGLGCWFVVSRGRKGSVNWVSLLGLVAGVAALVWAFRSLNLINWHTDSFRYVLTATLIGQDRFDLIWPNLLLKRMAAFPLTQGAAHLMGEQFLRSFAPLLSICTVWALSASLFMGLGSVSTPEGAVRPSGLTERQRAWYTACVAFLLVSNSRYIWNSFYINGHLLFATQLLILAGCGWLRVRQRGVSRPAMIVLQSGAAMTIAWVRPEGPVVAALALVPFMCCTRLSKRERIVPALALAASILVWHGYVALFHRRIGSPVPTSCAGLLVLGAALLAAAPLVIWQRLERIVRYVPTVAEAGIWVALAGLWLRKPQILEATVKATVANTALDKASWGSSVLVLFALVLLVLSFTRMPDRLLLRFPVTTFVPLGFLFAYLRGQAYRVGDGDSFSRMLIHIAPLAVLFIGSSLLAEWRWGQPAVSGSTTNALTPPEPV